MKLVRIEIKDMMGLEHLRLEPKTITVVRGRNAAGKTSTLESIRSVMRGGNDPSLVRRGAEKGTVSFLLDDGTEITRTQTAKTATVDVRVPVPGGGTSKISSPQRVVDSLVDTLGVDPMALVLCPPSKRAEYLLEVMPLKLDAGELREAAGRPVGLAKGNALDQIEAIRKALYDERTGVNRTARDKRIHVAQLAETLPPVGEPLNLAELRANRTVLEEEQRSGEREAAATRRAVEKKAAAERESAVDAIRSNAQGEVDAVREDAAIRIKAIERERDDAIGRIKDRARELAAEREAEERAACSNAQGVERVTLETLAATVGLRLKGLAEAIARGEEREKEYTRAEKTREIIAVGEREAAQAEAESKALSNALERLDALRLKLLEGLPIKGVEIRDGNVLVDGIPFERVNRARQMAVAFQVAKLRAGKLGLIVCDGLEALDAQGYREFEAAAEEAGLQFVVALRTEGDLAVETEKTEAAA